MNELIFIQYTFYIIGIFGVIKIFILEFEDIVVRFKKLKACPSEYVRLRKSYINNNIFEDISNFINILKSYSYGV